MDQAKLKALGRILVSLTPRQDLQAKLIKKVVACSGTDPTSSQALSLIKLLNEIEPAKPKAYKMRICQGCAIPLPRGGKLCVECEKARFKAFHSKSGKALVQRKKAWGRR